MERFVKVVNSWKPLDIFSKHSILDRQCSEYTSDFDINSFMTEGPII